MSFQSVAQSIFGARPIELYEFVRGSTIYRHTSADHDVSFGGNDFTASRAIKRTAIKDSADGGKSNIKISVSRDHPVVAEYYSVVPEASMSLTIRAGHEDDAEYVVLWVGEVIGVEWEDESTAAISCEPQFSRLKRNSLPYRYSPICQHTVYRGGCALSLPANSVTDNSTLVDGVEITIPDAALVADGEYIGGPIIYGGGEYRTIIAHVGTLLTINRPFGSHVTTGAEFQIGLGCDRSSARCKVLNNFDNFLGFETVPTKNIFSDGLK